MDIDPDITIYTECDRRVFSTLKGLGFSPAVVADIGASNGFWSNSMVSIFPEAKFHLFEPCADLVDQYRAPLKRVIAERDNFRLHAVALGARTGEIRMAITPDGFGSTILDVGVSQYFPSEATVPLTTLDVLIEESALPAPQLIKIDVQAAEDQILRGATNALKKAEVLEIECWLQKSYGPQTPLLWDINAYLTDLGFYLVETGFRYYDSLHCLIALDCYFLRRDIGEKWKDLFTVGSW